MKAKLLLTEGIAGGRDDEDAKDETIQLGFESETAGLCPPVDIVGSGVR